MNDDTSLTLSAQDCLVAVMIAVSASDEDIRTTELLKIQTAVNMLPVFSGYDVDRISSVSSMVFDLFEQEDGLDALFGLIKGALPDRNGLCVGLRCGRGRRYVGRSRITSAGRNPLRA